MNRMLENFRQRSSITQNVEYEYCQNEHSAREHSFSLTVAMAAHRNLIFLIIFWRNVLHLHNRKMQRKKLLNRNKNLPTKEQIRNRLYFSVRFSLLINWFSVFCRKTANRCNHSERRNSTADQCRMLSAYIATWTKRIAEPLAWSRHCMCAIHKHTRIINVWWAFGWLRRAIHINSQIELVICFVRDDSFGRHDCTSPFIQTTKKCQLIVCYR